MTDEAIDQAIFSMLAEMPGWRKVAGVVLRVAHAMGDDLTDGDEEYEHVAHRVEALVTEGRLIVQGDIKKPRFSEVRLPD
jgi:hypothetical protein